MIKLKFCLGLGKNKTLIKGSIYKSIMLVQVYLNLTADSEIKNEGNNDTRKILYT